MPLWRSSSPSGHWMGTGFVPRRSFMLLTHMRKSAPTLSILFMNATRGTRLVTYALPGPRGSGAICVNGAAAHLNQPGDIVIIATFADMTPEEARAHRPKVVRVDQQTQLVPGYDADEKPGEILDSLDLSGRPGLGSA